MRSSEVDESTESESDWECEAEKNKSRQCIGDRIGLEETVDDECENKNEWHAV